MEDEGLPLSEFDMVQSILIGENAMCPIVSSPDNEATEKEGRKMDDRNLSMGREGSLSPKIDFFFSSLLGRGTKLFSTFFSLSFPGYWGNGRMAFFSYFFPFSFFFGVTTWIRI